MGGFVKGDVVVLNFPFSDLSGTKRRPALVLADLKDDDIILCQITSIATEDTYAILIEDVLRSLKNKKFISFSPASRNLLFDF